VSIFLPAISVRKAADPVRFLAILTSTTAWLRSRRLSRTGRTDHDLE
jgi:hypothetical protein